MVSTPPRPRRRSSAPPRLASPRLAPTAGPPPPPSVHASPSSPVLRPAAQGLVSPPPSVLRPAAPRLAPTAGPSPPPPVPRLSPGARPSSQTLAGATFPVLPSSLFVSLRLLAWSGDYSLDDSVFSFPTLSSLLRRAVSSRARRTSHSEGRRVRPAPIGFHLALNRTEGPDHSQSKEELCSESWLTSWFISRTAIRDSILLNFGECGLAACLGSLQVKYVNAITKICVIRVSHDDHQRVWAAITMVTSIGKIPVSFNLLDVSDL
ncbi:hypothetical protein GUJ93_ZPchr0015g6671 [Zizania palustris]|uniref:Uncharacterized protein n=1 Tax=Zizania palustris TaxID=103762 RepID=A0A8J5SYT0_ZIZPA|nr:hypothetical protein GUJ93_ZPchr0015g6671 [Zizania palustris]